MDANLYYQSVPVPRGGVRFPLELEPPPGFVPDRPETWPEVPGRLEYSEGRLWFMPPCGDVQQLVAVDVLGVLYVWRQAHPEFLVAGNEAGMILDGQVRGADAAVWTRASATRDTGGYQRTPPVLAVEISGQEEPESKLEEKARWYLERGVQVVWLVLPSSREVVVHQPEGARRFQVDERLPVHPALPELAPDVDSFFRQLASP